MLKLIFIIPIVICCLFIYASCVVSGRISREEENLYYDKEDKKSVD